MKHMANASTAGQPVPAAKPTLRQAVTAHLERVREWREGKAESIRRFAAEMVDDLKLLDYRFTDGSRYPVNALGHFQGGAPAFDVMCAELGAMDEQIAALAKMLEATDGE